MVFDIEVGLYIDVCQYGAMELPQIDAQIECCGEVLGASLSEEEADALAARLKALADPSRLRLLNAIANHSGGEACVCELTAPIGLSQPTVSHHLKVLHAAGLLERERRGTWIFYRVNPASLEALTAALSPGPSRARGTVSSVTA